MRDKNGYTTVNMSSRELEDEIIRFRKLPMDAHAASSVDEAAEALAAGRELEAEALVEKVAAWLRRGMSVAS